MIYNFITKVMNEGKKEIKNGGAYNELLIWACWTRLRIEKLFILLQI